jgi:prophage tail gpP-like protein
MEWTDSNLLTIATDLCLPHGVYCDFQAPSGPSFKRVDIQPGGMVLQFLADLAQQRGPVISSSPHGSMLVWEGVQPGNPVARFEDGQPGVRIKATIDEDRYYSSVTGTVPARTKRGGKKDRGAGAKFTVRNPYANDQVRPYNVEFSDIDPGELETAVEALAGRVFSDIVSVGVELARWTDDNGKILEPNTTVLLKSPDYYIEDWYEFLIADVMLFQSSDGARTASMRCTLPGAYTGEIPGVLPWQ